MSAFGTRCRGNQQNEDAIFAGAVYVLTRTGTQWSQLAYVKASNTETLDFFGSSVGLNADGSLGEAGAVYLY